MIDIIQRIVKLEKRLDDLVKPERGWQPHFLDSAYTNNDFDGDSFSSVAANTKIENTSWSTTIPSNAKALIILALARDSDSTNTDGLWLSLYSTAAGTIAPVSVMLNGIPSDEWQTETGIVPCTDGDIWYRINASGAGTFDVFLYCLGYWN